MCPVCRTSWELYEIPRNMRQYFEEFEAACGAPWERVVKKGKVTSRGGSSTAGRGKLQMSESGPMERRASDGTNVSQYATEWEAHEKITLSWQPTCSCAGDPEQIAWDVKMGLLEYEPIAAIVLDPFMGSGTTALVALEHRRHYFGIELNPDYISMANRRIKLIQPRMQLW